MQVFRLLFDIEQAGYDLALGGVVLEKPKGRGAVMHFIVGSELAQCESGTVVLFNNLARTGLVLYLVRHAAGYEIEPVYGLIVLADEIEALGRPGVVVEGNTGRNHVDESRSLMRDRRFDDRDQLMLVARKGAGDKACAQLQGHRHQI